MTMRPALALDKPVLDPALVAEGKEIFRFDTFGDEGFWTDVLHIDKAILGDANGGFGSGVSPATALAVGLKVDAEALPASSGYKHQRRTGGSKRPRYYSRLIGA